MQVGGVSPYLAWVGVGEIHRRSLLWRGGDRDSLADPRAGSTVRRRAATTHGALVHTRYVAFDRFVVIGLAICASLAACGPAWSTEADGLAPTTSFAFEEGHLIDSFERAGVVTDFPATLEANEQHADVEPAASAASAWSSGAVIRRTVAVIPEYLPEGMIPIITGPTSDAHRATAAGRPLQGTSWLANSHSAGMFLGVIGGAALIDDHLEQSVGGLFGLRFGIDYDHRWGLEKRFGFAQMNVYDLIQHQRQIVSLELGDVDWMFYPWGDTLWRPYMSTGVGLAHFNYESETGRHIDRLLIGLPFGIGLKYFWNEGVAVRFEIVDNLMLGTREISTMNNLAVLLGIEFRYSGFHFGYES